MRGSLFIAGLILAVVEATAQNLVPNPGFEIYETCPDSYTNRAPRKLVPHWRIPTRGTTDYYNKCSRFNVGVPMNMMGNCFAAEGVAYAGMILLEHPVKAEQGERPVNYREFLQAKLEKPLESGSKYRVSCSFSFAGHSLYIAPALGMHFSEKRISRRRVHRAAPLVAMDTCNFEYEKEVWYEWADTITASGGEEYLTMGNFYKDLDTPYRETGISQYKGFRQRVIKENGLAYLFIDQVSVEKMNPE